MGVIFGRPNFRLIWILILAINAIIYQDRLPIPDLRKRIIFSGATSTASRSVTLESTAKPPDANHQASSLGYFSLLRAGKCLITLASGSFGSGSHPYPNHPKIWASYKRDCDPHGPFIRDWKRKGGSVLSDPALCRSNAVRRIYPSVGALHRSTSF